MASSLDTQTPIQSRGRTKIACKACHARRVKCDAGDGQPCMQCRNRDTPCELIDSRRGKYSRQRRSTRQTQSTSTAESIIVDSSVSVTPKGRGQDHQAQLSFSNVEEDPSSAQNAQDAEPRQQDRGPRALYESLAEPQPQPNSRSYVVEVTYNINSAADQPLKVQYPVPSVVVDQVNRDRGRLFVQPPTVQEALELPPRAIADELIRTFFTIIHPAYPVFDRKNFVRLYNNRGASPLVLQTMFFLGFAVGKDSLFQEAGYGDRCSAREVHYRRAKALYDADYECDRVLLAGVLLLFGFSWPGPEDQKDMLHWHGCAATLAKSLSMHRSLEHSSISPAARSLRKRIWWSIYPPSIRDQDCDVELLTDDDFSFDKDVDGDYIPEQKGYHTAYVRSMSRLTMIMGDIYDAEFSLRRQNSAHLTSSNLSIRLESWESNLTPDLRLSVPTKGFDAPFWASMLHLSYQNSKIILFRLRSTESSVPDVKRHELATIAANSITRIAEDLLTVGVIKSGLIHQIPALFSALSVHTLTIWGNDSIQRQLAETRSRVCLLALSELSETWPVRVWIARAFANMLRRLAGHNQACVGRSTINVAARVAGNASTVTSASETSTAASADRRPTQLGVHPTEDELLTSGTTQPAERAFWDSLWAGNLDDSFDVDSIMNQGLWPIPTFHDEIEFNEQTGLE